MSNSQSLSDRQMFDFMHQRVVNFLLLIRDNGLPHHKKALDGVDKVASDVLQGQFFKLMMPVLEDAGVKKIVTRWVSFWETSLVLPTEGIDAVERSIAERADFAKVWNEDLVSVGKLVADHMPLLVPEGGMEEFNKWLSGLDSELLFRFFRFLHLFIDAHDGFSS